MGQQITVKPLRTGDVVVYDTNRSITGQDGAAYAPGMEPTDDFGSRLAAEIFAADAAVDHVFVASNEVVVRRSGGWDETAESAIGEVISEFFIYYDGEREVAQPE